MSSSPSLSTKTNHKWEANDIFLRTNDPQLGYHRRKDEDKRSIHWGQRKLGLVLIQFLTRYWDPLKVKNPVVVYAGAAPGTNIKIVSDFFPEIEFHLYDPSPFKIKGSDKIHIYQQYFTDKDAEKWKNRNDIYFVSDIRTADYTKAKNLDENERTIMKDMEMQMRWYNIISPVKGHLKFRLPYTGGNRPDRMNYLYGHVLKQPWAPQTTTETRLVPVGHQIVSWSCQMYQDQMFHHNVITREQYNYTNPFTHTDEPIDSPELMNDWDSMMEVQIWMEYLLKRTGKSEMSMVTALSRLFTNKLTQKARYKDTLSLLRSKPQFIKNRNFKPSRDNIDTIKPVNSTRDSSGLDISKPPVISNDNDLNLSTIDVVKNKNNNLADTIGL